MIRLGGKFALLSLLALLLLAATASAAQNPATAARTTLEATVNNILQIVRQPEYADSATRPPLRQQIEDDVFRIFDFAEFSSRTVGPRWKSFSASQKKNFENAFAQLLLNTYLSRVNGYNGETVNYTGETVAPEGNKVEVKTVITMQDGKKTPVSYRMLYKNGSWRVYDVIIENISLVKNYRAQFHDILNTATPDQLTAKVKAKAAEVAAQKAK